MIRRWRAADPVGSRLACALLRRALGWRTRSLAARLETRRFHEWPLEDTATLALETTSGASHIFLTWTTRISASNHIEIDCERGNIRVVDDNVVVTSNSQERRWSCPPSLSEGSHSPDWFGGVAADFLAAATAGSTATWTRRCCRSADRRRPAVKRCWRRPAGICRLRRRMASASSRSRSRAARKMTRKKYIGAPSAAKSRNQSTCR